MAAFGIPQAHEDDAERAVRAASAILDSVHELGLEARIGVEAGEVVADESDSTFATGEAVNVAARLQQAAQPGEILIGPFARRLTIGRRRDRGARPARAEGLRRAAARLAAARLRDSDGRVPSVAAPFVGRDFELELLENTLGARHARQARAPLHDLRRAGRRQEPARARVPRGRRGARHPRRPLAPLRRGRHLLAARRDGQGRRRDLGRRPRPGGGREAARELRRRRRRRPARARRRRARGDRGRAQPAGDRLGGARVGGRARRRAAADPRLRGRPLGRGAAARADRAPRRARQGRAAADPLPRAAGAARRPARAGAAAACARPRPSSSRSRPAESEELLDALLADRELLGRRARSAAREDRGQPALRRGDDPDAARGRHLVEADPRHAPGDDRRPHRPAAAEREAAAAARSDDRPDLLGGRGRAPAARDRGPRAGARRPAPARLRHPREPLDDLRRARLPVQARPDPRRRLRRPRQGRACRAARAGRRLAARASPARS